jgi:Ser/Thr protein kinase RdoA (MazF antagonist)
MVLDAHGAALLVRDRFGIDGVATSLPSYSDENYKITASDGQRFVLRVANEHEHHQALSFQHAVLTHLAKRGVAAPRIVLDLAGQGIGRVGFSGVERLVRMHRWIEGETLFTVSATRPLLAELGRRLGEMDLALRDLEQKPPQREFVWDMRQSGRIRRCLGAVQSGSRRSRLEGILDHFEGELLDTLVTLRGGPIHNDANGHNVLVEQRGDNGPSIAGLTDYGDSLRAAWVCEPAIAAAYAMMPPTHVDLLEAGVALVGGYHMANPLTREELGLVPALIETRLAVSVASSAYLRQKNPENAYISIDEEPGWALLQWLDQGGRERLRSTLLAQCQAVVS